MSEIPEERRDKSCLWMTNVLLCRQIGRHNAHANSSTKALLRRCLEGVEDPSDQLHTSCGAKPWKLSRRAIWLSFQRLFSTHFDFGVELAGLFDGVVEFVTLLGELITFLHEVITITRQSTPLIGELLSVFENLVVLFEGFKPNFCGFGTRATGMFFDQRPEGGDCLEVVLLGVGGVCGAHADII